MAHPPQGMGFLSLGWVRLCDEDVSGENHGFDVRSSRCDDGGSFADVHYIEVKARVRSGAIRLSASEWKKARRFGEKYWLHVVTQAASDAPRLQRVQNPAGHLRMNEDIFATGFIVPEERWQERTEGQAHGPSEPRSGGRQV